jgi:hypothetical protein
MEPVRPTNHATERQSNNEPNNDRTLTERKPNTGFRREWPET